MSNVSQKTGVGKGMAYLATMEESDGMLRIEVHERDKDGSQPVALLVCDLAPSPGLIGALSEIVTALGVAQ